MRPLLLALACAASACATSSSTIDVRDLDGQPRPTTARLDADAAPPLVHCRDGASYFIVPDEPRPFLVGTRVGGRQAVVRDARTLCAKISAAN